MQGHSKESHWRPWPPARQGPQKIPGLCIYLSSKKTLLIVPCPKRSQLSWPRSLPVAPSVMATLSTPLPARNTVLSPSLNPTFRPPSILSLASSGPLDQAPSAVCPWPCLLQGLLRLFSLL